TWREETPSELLLPTELHYNTVENEDNDEDYSPDQLYAQSTCKHFHGKRTREQLSEEEEVEEAPPSKRQRMEQEDEVVELLSSSSSLSLFPILDPIPSIDVHPRNEQMADVEGNDEEAPPRTRQHVEQEDELSELTNLDINSSSSLTLSPALEFIPIIDSSSSSHHFWWRWRVSDREQTSSEEDNDGETPTERLEHVEQEDNENEVYFISLERSPSPSLNLSTTSDFMLFVVDSSGNEYGWWIRQYEDIDEEMPTYDSMPHQNGTPREETPPDLLPPTELHYNTVENKEDDDDYSPDPQSATEIKKKSI
ncbi:uncharacterized protein LOC113642732, partial [Tachysurus ichikawai]